MQNRLNDITYKIIGCAYTVHSQLGPGLLESAYQACLEYELLHAGLKIESQKPLPVIYRDLKLDAGYRIDFIVEDEVIVEIKSVEAIADIHRAQVLTYLKLADKNLGLLLNFNVVDMKTGIHRLALKEYIAQLS